MAPQGEPFNQTKMKGFYIAIEGIDGCGKSTLAKRLFDAIRTMTSKCILISEPSNTTFGQNIRCLLQEDLDPKTTLLLLCADRAKQLQTTVKEALLDQKIIVSDRSFYSMKAYQGYGDGLPFQVMDPINDWITNKRRPDLVLVLGVDPRVAYQRMQIRGKKLDRFETKKIEYWNKVQEGYREMCQRYSNFRYVNANVSSDEVFQQAWDFMLAVCDRCASNSFGVALNPLNRII